MGRGSLGRGEVRPEPQALLTALALVYLQMPAAL